MDYINRITAERLENAYKFECRYCKDKFDTRTDFFITANYMTVWEKFPEGEMQMYCSKYCANEENWTCDYTEHRYFSHPECESCWVRYNKYKDPYYTAELIPECDDELFRMKTYCVACEEAVEEDIKNKITRNLKFHNEDRYDCVGAENLWKLVYESEIAPNNPDGIKIKDDDMGLCNVCNSWKPICKFLENDKIEQPCKDCFDCEIAPNIVSISAEEQKMNTYKVIKKYNDQKELVKVIYPAHYNMAKDKHTQKYKYVVNEIEKAKCPDQRREWVDAYNKSLPQVKQYDANAEKEISYAVGGIYDSEYMNYIYDDIETKRIREIKKIQKDIAEKAKCPDCGGPDGDDCVPCMVKRDAEDPHSDFYKTFIVRCGFYVEDGEGTIMYNGNDLGDALKVFEGFNGKYKSSYEWVELYDNETYDEDGPIKVWDRDSEVYQENKKKQKKGSGKVSKKFPPKTEKEIKKREKNYAEVYAEVKEKYGKMTNKQLYEFLVENRKTVKTPKGKTKDVYLSALVALTMYGDLHKYRDSIGGYITLPKYRTA